MNEEEIKEEDETLCEYEDVIKGNCSQGKMDLDYIDIIKENLFNEEGDDFYKKIKTGNVIIQFSNLDEQDDNETSSIDLGDCESKLRTIYEIPDDMQLIVYKVDIKNSDASSTYVQYEVYNPVNKSLLNLSICDSITVNTPVNISNEMEEIYNSLSESGYNLFDSEDDFYQDICSTYTTANGTDMLLSDRKKDIYSTTEDISLCQTGCELESYNSTTKKAKCNCEVSTTSSVNSDLDIDSLFTKETIKSSFYETLASSNFRVLQCYKIVFSNNIKKNIGQIFMTAVAVIFICFNSFSFLIYQKQINSFIISISDINNDNVINSSPMNEKKNDINNINNSEVDEKKEKKSKKKKKKKKKAKKEENTNLFPPKKLKKKNKMNQMEIQISHDELVNKDKIDSNTNNINISSNTKKDILIYSTIDNEKIKSENNNDKINSNVNFTKEIKETQEKDENEITDINTLNDQEINDLNYDIALKIDKRTYFQYYWSLLKKKQLILFTFWPANDYNLLTIKISLFLLSFGLYFSINGFFFTDDTMHKIYEDKGVYNIVFQIPQILFSTIISAVINVLLKKLSLTEANILSIKKEKDNQKKMEKSKSIQKCLKIKFILYFTLSLLFMIFFWYFISCFCGVYKNTQIILIKDTLISYALSMVYPFALNLLPGLFRIPALKAEKGDQSCKYKISQYIALI